MTQLRRQRLPGIQRWFSDWFHVSPRRVSVLGTEPFSRYLRSVALAVGVMAGAVAATPLMAAESADRIVAVVNDDAITMRELDERVRMALLMAHVQDSVEVRKRTLPQILRKMIDERLTMQDAKRYKVTANPGEVEASIHQVESNNGMPDGSLLKELSKHGISPDTMRGLLAAEITWVHLSQGLFQGSAKVGDEEINDRLEMLASQLGKPEFNLAEIFLAVDNPSQDEQAKSLGERLIEQLHEGAPFQVLASQFSQSASASNGGLVGWVTPGSIDDDLMRVVETMAPGSYSNLIRTGDGYHILALVQRRIIGTGVPGAQSTLTFAQMVLPVPPNGPPKSSLFSKATTLVKGANTCDDFLARGRKEAALGVETTGPITASQLPKELQAQVINIPEGGISAPIDDPQGIRMVMMCKRVDVPAPLPNKDQIRRQIEEERVDMMGRRYMRDLRRSAFIDIRL